MAKQHVPVAKRLTVDGLNDMGVQAPIIIQPKPKFPYLGLHLVIRFHFSIVKPISRNYYYIDN